MSSDLLSLASANAMFEAGVVVMVGLVFAWGGVVPGIVVVEWGSGCPS